MIVTTDGTYRSVLKKCLPVQQCAAQFSPRVWASATLYPTRHFLPSSPVTSVDHLPCQSTWRLIKALTKPRTDEPMGTFLEMILFLLLLFTTDESSHHYHNPPFEHPSVPTVLVMKEDTIAASVVLTCDNVGGLPSVIPLGS